MSTDHLTTAESSSFKLLLRSLPQPSVLLTLDLRIILVSQAYRDLVGGLPEEVFCGRPFFEVFRQLKGQDIQDDKEQNDLEALKQSIESARDTRRICRMSVSSFEPVSGQPGEIRIRTWRVTNTPLLERDGSLTAILHQVEETQTPEDQVQMHTASEPIEMDREVVLLSTHEMKSYLDSQEILKLSQARLQEAQRLGRMGDWQFDIQTGEIGWSEELYRLYRRDPALGTPNFQELCDYYIPEDAKRLQECMDRAIQTGESYEVDLQTRFNGREDCFHFTLGRAVRDQSGKIIKLFGILQDITDRKSEEKAKAKLLASLNHERQKLTQIFQQAPNFLIVLRGQNHVCEFANDSAYDLLGSRKLVGLPWAEALPETVSQGFFARLDRVLATGQPDFGYDKPILLKRQIDGDLEERIVNFIYYPLTEDDGSRTGIVIQGSDVTDGRRAERKVIQQAALIDQASDGIIVCDLDHRITFWSQGAERIYGWKSSEVVGRKTYSLFDMDPEALATAKEGVQRNDAWSGEVEKTTASGKRLIIDSRWTLLHDSSGVPNSILTFDSDITEHKELEKQFYRAQRLESIGTLAGGIAHDLNNMLAPILLSIELLRRTKDSKHRARALDQIETSALRGAEMVKQVLSYARGVQGQRNEIEIESLVQDVCKVVNETFLKSIKVKTEIPPGLCPVLGDQTQLQQVLLNLCVNARDAMPEGGLLRISARAVTLNDEALLSNEKLVLGDYILLSIEDSGTGMKPQVLDQIFDPFFTTKDVGEGTGLGLSTSLAIVKSHGGTLRVQSEYGEGSRFDLLLPAVKRVAREKPTESCKISGESPSEIHAGNGELILIVDDEEILRDITQVSLESFGYRTVSAGNGAEALAIYRDRSTEISLVLTDIMMGTMDGPTSVQAIRKLNSEVPIIGTSGLYTGEVLDRMAAAGITHFLPKPYSAESLLQILKKALAD